MSLIAFGFTIFKFFQYLSTTERRREPIVSPWVFGVVMILVGVSGLILAWIQHRQEIKALEAEVGATPYVGRRPILTAGNSGGDREMLEWAQAAGSPSLALLIDHNDAEREFHYTSTAQTFVEP
jgi:hypothetical protein